MPPFPKLALTIAALIAPALSQASLAQEQPVEHPRFGPDWIMRFQFQFLFPKR